MTTTGIIVDALDRAQIRVHVEAYALTSVPIGDALTRAHQRGIPVEIICDRDNTFQTSSLAGTLNGRGLRVLVDKSHNEFHDKVMIIGYHLTITGSFNYSANAQDRNAENLVLLQSYPLNTH